MALSENRILKSVDIQLTTKTANVLWSDQILRDGEVITEANHRKAYTEDQKDEFLAEVDGAENYLSALGW
jgi:hypothetical protein